MKKRNNNVINTPTAAIHINYGSVVGVMEKIAFVLNYYENEDLFFSTDASMRVRIRKKERHVKRDWSDG